MEHERLTIHIKYGGPWWDGQYILIFQFSVSTPPPTCQNPPDILNGRVISTGPYQDGSVALYTCNDCFAGSPRATCRSGSWDQPQPPCSRKFANYQMYYI